uniref:Endonuclease/exonuclease/phosphatase domain-containing protein n=1 Tax=Aureoumbra lagunensis TaxID=44058 RepID=A0A7S3K2Y9_9STRA
MTILSLNLVQRMIFFLIFFFQEKVVNAFFRLCTINIHDGGSRNLNPLFERFFVPWCEVAVINECFLWKKKNAVETAKNHGFALEIQASPGGRDLGILAKLDLLSIRRGNFSETGTAHGFHHGVLHCIVQQEKEQVHILATHLTPHSAARRRLEARKLIAIVQNLEAADAKAAVVVAGDFNTLSPLDKAQHTQQFLHILQQNPRLRAKFLVTPEPESTIDYMPMRILLTDLVDVAYSHASDNSNEQPHPTVPTERHADKLHAIPMRLDYVLLNAQAAAILLDSDGRAIHIHTQIDEFTKQASDHYPLVVDLPKSALTQRTKLNVSSNDHRQNHYDLADRNDYRHEHNKKRAFIHKRNNHQRQYFPRDNKLEAPSLTSPEKDGTNFLQDNTMRRRKATSHE